ncbi:MAG: methyltransferase domain-containing protein, partial [Dehalococcoidia bacterium]
MEQIFDRDLIVQHKLRALRMAVPGADFLLRHAIDDLSLRLSAVERRFASAAALHGHSPTIARSLSASGKVDRVLQVECDPVFLDVGSSEGNRRAVSPLEELPLADGSIDLAVSLLSLHETNDTPGLLAQIRRALRPDGLLLAALPGQGTLAELRTALLAAETEIAGGASPRVAPLMEVRDAGALLQRAGFALPVTDSESLTVRYDTMFDLMRDLRAMGATNMLIARSRTPSNRRMFMRA